MHHPAFFYLNLQKKLFLAVLRIRDILVRIRIQIHWSGSRSADPHLWITDPDLDPDRASLVSDLQDGN